MHNTLSLCSQKSVLVSQRDVWVAKDLRHLGDVDPGCIHHVRERVVGPSTSQEVDMYLLAVWISVQDL